MSDLHPSEVKVYGVHAVDAVFRNRPEAIVRAYVAGNRIGGMGDQFRELATRRVAYHIVPDEDLERISGSRHHEGLVIIARRRPILTRDDLLDRVADGRGPLTLLALDGVQNPHNLGAVLRVAAHFGVPAVLIPELEGEAGLSSAVFRTAEGGAECVDVAVVGPLDPALTLLAGFGMAVIATSSHADRSLYETDIPERVVLVVGGESDGVSALIAARATAYVSIPGSGQVESLNVATATAVLLSEVARRGMRGPG